MVFPMMKQQEKPTLHSPHIPGLCPMWLLTTFSNCTSHIISGVSISQLHVLILFAFTGISTLVHADIDNFWCRYYQ